MKNIFLSILLLIQINLFAQSKFYLSARLLDSIIYLTDSDSERMPFFLFKFIPKNKHEFLVSYTGIYCSQDIPLGIFGIYQFGERNILILNDGLIFDDNLVSKIIQASDPRYQKIIDKYFVKDYDGVTVYRNLAVLSIRNRSLNNNQYVIKSKFYLPYAKAPESLWPIKYFGCQPTYIYESYSDQMKRYGFESDDGKDEEYLRKNTWKVKISL